MDVSVGGEDQPLPQPKDGVVRQDGELQHHLDKLEGVVGVGEHADYYRGLYHAAAVSEYDPTCPDNQYLISSPNGYYLALIARGENDGKWVLGEDE